MYWLYGQVRLSLVWGPTSPILIITALTFDGVTSGVGIHKKGVCKLFMEIHLTSTECHLPCGITQCYLPPDTSEHTPPLPQPDRLVLDLPTTYKDGGLSKPRPMVQRATGPRWLRDSPGQRDPNTWSSERYSSTLTTRLLLMLGVVCLSVFEG